MITVYKYPVGSEIEMPAGAIILHAAEQDREVCLWAMADTTHELETRWFRCMGTGCDTGFTEGDNHVFISTVLMTNGYVWHIFELVES